MSHADVALGLAADRMLDPVRFRIGASVPRHAVRPRDRDEVAEAMHAAARERLAVVPWGAGVALAREPAPSRYDLALDLTALDRLVEYDPEDLTLTAECGVTIAALRATLAARGQELPLEAAHADRATLGGVLAADASGCRRLRFGAPHDRVLGARLALADGTLARSGGKVVKNVAGYGTHRLLCGSRGGLALIVEASLKLAPAPEARLVLCFDLAPAMIGEPAGWRWLTMLEPAFASVVGRAAAARLPAGVAGAAALTLVVGLEDEAAWVSEQESRVSAALGAPRARFAAQEASAVVQALADLEEQEGPRISFVTSGNTPPALVSLAGGAHAERMVFHAPAGRLHLFPPREQAPALIRTMADQGFTVRAGRDVGDRPASDVTRAGVLALRARIRTAFDPAGSLALGERWVAGDSL